MSRRSKTANYGETLNQTIRLAEALPLAVSFKNIIRQKTGLKRWQNHHS